VGAQIIKKEEIGFARITHTIVKNCIAHFTSSTCGRAREKVSGGPLK